MSQVEVIFQVDAEAEIDAMDQVIRMLRGELEMPAVQIRCGAYSLIFRRDEIAHEVKRES